MLVVVVLDNGSLKQLLDDLAQARHHGEDGMAGQEMSESENSG